jgi:chromosome segregation protein
MRLTRIEIHGFKSFADRTQLELPPGLTAVVGPNGCGKSNVIDAIKWALGEQRPTAMRGDEMLDVIFKGNGARPARNFAEVSLVFDNAARTLPIDFTEVVVSRRLFRSGESDYLINRQPVRLKDVRDLFMDTGLGTGAYSIMEQGRIDAVLSADAQDRRRIFEEAAGISRYRARRRESESKLERTEQNLLRLGDVVEELEKQTRSLKQQAGRARSFLVARDRMRELKSRFYVHRWDELGRQLEALAAEGQQAAAGEAAQRAELAAARQEASVLQERLGQARAAVDAAADEFRRLTSQAEAFDGRRAALREREGETQARGEQLRARLAGLELAVAERAAEARQLAARLAALTDELAAAEARLATRAAAEGQAARAADEARARLEALRRQALARQGELTAARNERADADSRHAVASATHVGVLERASELRAQLEEQNTVQGVLFADAASVDQARGAASRASDERRAERDAVQARQQALEVELARLRESLAAVSSRHATVEELLARREGVSRGAVSLLSSGLPGIDGLVADRLRAPRELSEAVEAALGVTAEAVLVATRADALAALEHLAAHGGGRVQLLPRDELRPRSGSAEGTRLLDRIEVVGDRAAIEALLGHVRLVPDRAALAGCKLDGSTVWVTPEGELLDERGVLRGGRFGGEGGLVTRRAECDALAVQAGELRSALEAATVARQELQGEAGLVDQRLAESERALRRLESERERLAERESQGAARRQALERELQLVLRDAAAAERELASSAAARDAAAARAAQLEGLVASDRSQDERQDAERAALEEALAAERAGTGEARLQLSTLRERQQALSAEERQVLRAADERQQEHVRAQAELESLTGQSAALREEIGRAEAEQARCAEARDAAAGVLAGAREGATTLGERLATVQTAVQAREVALSAASEELGAHRLREQELTIHRQTLRDRVRDELEVDLEVARPEIAPTGPAAPSDASAEGGSPAAGDAAPAASDWTAIEAEIEELRDRLSRMGNVNLAAVDELTQVEERLAFLTAQRDDLLAAKGSLMDTIAKVDKESRERFLATFEEIRGHFRQIFRKLFRGGKADVFLAEGEDVLEAGIDIVAAPPGKDPRSISLLSGGERTLTAVGLLFSLFRAKPSPVCMLDEVDAALDETNIDRFCTVLEDFLAGSQFVVVTHARRTMSYADTLYGITMEEHGVSRALSLTLQEYETRKRGEPVNGDALADAASSGASGAEARAPRPRARVAEAAAEAAEGGASV